jgi:hypothetical protein
MVVICLVGLLGATRLHTQRFLQASRERFLRWFEATQVGGAELAHFAVRVNQWGAFAHSF